MYSSPVSTPVASGTNAGQSITVLSRSASVTMRSMSPTYSYTAAQSPPKQTVSHIPDATLDTIARMYLAERKIEESIKKEDTEEPASTANLAQLVPTYESLEHQYSMFMIYINQLPLHLRTFSEGLCFPLFLAFYREMVSLGLVNESYLFFSQRQATFVNTHRDELASLSKLASQDSSAQSWRPAKTNVSVSVNAWDDLYQFIINNNLFSIQKGLLEQVNLTILDAVHEGPRQPGSGSYSNSTLSIYPSTNANELLALAMRLKMNPVDLALCKDYVELLNKEYLEEKQQETNMLSYYHSTSNPQYEQMYKLYKSRVDLLDHIRNRVVSPNLGRFKHFLDAMPHIPPLNRLQQTQISTDIKCSTTIDVDGGVFMPSAIMYTILNSNNQVSHINMSHDGAWCVMGCKDSSLRLYNFNNVSNDNNNHPVNFNIDLPDGLSSPQSSPTTVNPSVATTHLSDSIWPLISLNTTTTTTTPNNATDSTPAAGSEQPQPQQTSQQPQHHRLNGHSAIITASSFSPCNQYLLTADASGAVFLWSTATCTLAYKYKAHSSAVWCVQWGPRGYYFLTGSHDGSAMLWATDQSQPVRIFSHYSCNYRVNNTICQTNAAVRTNTHAHMVLTLNGLHQSRLDITCVEWHPNMNYIFTATNDGVIRMFSIADGLLCRMFVGHTGIVRVVILYIILSYYIIILVYYDSCNHTLSVLQPVSITCSLHYISIFHLPTYRSVVSPYPPVVSSSVPPVQTVK